jgi:acyl-CoA reductase-like NAD-dependent aldehyde dehydrogenase
VIPRNAFVLARLRSKRAFQRVCSTSSPVVGEALAVHPDVDMIALTGSR